MMEKERCGTCSHFKPIRIVRSAWKGNCSLGYVERTENATVCKNYRKKGKTNGDRLRGMTDDELAEELSLIATWSRKELAKAKKCPGLKKFMLDWLKGEAKR